MCSMPVVFLFKLNKLFPWQKPFSFGSWSESGFSKQDNYIYTGGHSCGSGSVFCGWSGFYLKKFRSEFNFEISRMRDRFLKKVKIRVRFLFSGSGPDTVLARGLDPNPVNLNPDQKLCQGPHRHVFHTVTYNHSFNSVVSLKIAAENQKHKTQYRSDV